MASERRVRVLSEDQKASYRENGFLVLERIIPDDWLERLRSEAGRITASTAALQASTRKVALHHDHRAGAPKPAWIWNPDEDSEDVWSFFSDSLLVDAVADLIGPDVRFNYCLLYYRRAGGVYDGVGCGFWHQDCAYFPQTNTDGLYVNLHLEGGRPECAHTSLVPGSHRGPIFDHTDGEGRFRGHIAGDDLRRIALDAAIALTPPAGSVEIFHFRTVHNDDAGVAEDGPPSFQALYTAADAFPYRSFTLGSARHGTIVRGQPVRRARHDPEGCPVPHDLADIERFLSGRFEGSS